MPLGEANKNSKKGLPINRAGFLVNLSMKQENCLPNIYKIAHQSNILLNLVKKWMKPLKQLLYIKPKTIIIWL